MNSKGLITTLSLCAFLVLGCNDGGGGGGDGVTGVGKNNGISPGTGGLFPSGDGDSEQGTTCSAILACFEDCDVESCFDDCFSAGTTSAQELLTAMETCSTDSGCEDWDCVEARCGSQVSACQSDSGGGFNLFGTDPGTDLGNDPWGDPGSDPGIDPWGDPGTETDPGTAGSLSCSGIYDCYGTCSETDEDCWDNCYFEGTVAAQDQIWDLYDCAEETGCQDGDCMNEYCGYVVEACFGEGTSTGTGGESGTGGVELSCNDILNCFGGCSQNDQVCLEDCYYQGSYEAQDALTALSNCIEISGCQDDACVQERCYSEVAGCVE